MALLRQIEARRAYRALDSRPVPPEILERLVEAARLAPSCANNQPWRIVTVTEASRLEALKQSLTSGNYWARKAPAIAAFITDLRWDARLDGGRDYALFDLGQAAMAYQLQAVEEGLIAHPIAGFDPATAARSLGLPEGAVLATLVILGFPGESSGLSEKHLAAESAPRSRKPLEEVAAFEAWDERLLPAKKA